MNIHLAYCIITRHPLRSISTKVNACTFRH